MNERDTGTPFPGSTLLLGEVTPFDKAVLLVISGPHVAPPSSVLNNVLTVRSESLLSPERIHPFLASEKYIAVT
ncbi:hypothetical protein D3C76_1505720 [compost metagenome]